MTFRKLSTGNYTARKGKYYAFIFHRPHGGWCAYLRLSGQLIGSEGYHTTSLPTVSKAAEWVEEKITKHQNSNQ